CFTLPPWGKGRVKPNTNDGSLPTYVFFSCRTMQFLLAKNSQAIQKYLLYINVYNYKYSLLKIMLGMILFIKLVSLICHI
ncbi:MAG: hypothetical protein SVV67_08545, partial [Bacillota bacterium]|nr:hypothetical protein [Bacillota bacterium]